MILILEISNRVRYFYAAIFQGYVMFEIQSKIKRQIEILGLCLSENEKITTLDLSEFFKVEELTIKRDLQELRSYGIDIHSTRKNGVCLSASLDNSKLIEAILHYMGLNHTSISIDKSTSLLVEKFGSKALNHIVILQLCIDKGVCAVVDYSKNAKRTERNKKIKPLLIFQNEGTWRLLVQAETGIKQFILDKIEGVKMTEEKFKKIPRYKLEDLFKFSWKSWLGSEKYYVKLHISKVWAERIQNRILIKDQKIIEQEDGSIIFEVIVNALSEIASWIVSRGEGIKVIDPKALREEVINLAKGALKNYL